MSDVPSSRDTPLKQLYDVEHIEALKRDNDALMQRIADLELMMRARLQRVPKQPEDQNDLERAVAGLSQKIEDDDLLHEERVKTMLAEVRRANDETAYFKEANDESQDALWRILRAADKALGYTGLVSVKNPVRALWTLQKKNDQLKGDLYRMKVRKDRLQERIYDMTRPEGSPTAADLKSALYAKSGQHQ